MKTLSREQVDAMVRQVEGEAYALALAALDPPADAGAIVLEAFEAEAPAFPRSTVSELQQRLRKRIGRTAIGGAQARRPLPAELHTQVVDRVEELQYVDATRRRKTILLSLLGASVVLALIAVEWVRLDALAAAQPAITQASPGADAVEVPLNGEVRVIFGRKPAGPPHVKLKPSDGQLDSQAWDGTTLIVSYHGLHYAAHYQLILDAEYQSRLNDRGHYRKQWSFTTEHYPVLVGIAPSSGATAVARNGVLELSFNHQPLVEPRITLQPADSTMQSGQWNGSAWAVRYAGLKPVTTYRATVVVDYGVASANITRSWTFTTEPGLPPAGVPVLWHSRNDPGNFGNLPRMIALDWNGNLAGTMYERVTTQSPDGSIVGTADGIYLNRNGDRLSLLSGTAYYPVIADDDRSVCELSSNLNGRIMGQLWLMFGPLTGPLRAVAPVGSFDNPPELGLIACSVLSDRAVITYSGMGGPTAVTVFQLSTGRVVYQHAYTLAVSNVVSARDGRYLAELMPTHGSQGAPTETIIRRVTDGVIVARLDNQVAMRFSWDDQRVVATTSYQVGQPNVVTLIAWQSGNVLWTLPVSDGQSQSVFAWAEPNGGKMAVASATLASWPLDRLWLVDADGRANLVLSEVFYSASVTGS